jgi:signal transduction histidine kinase
MLRRKLLLRLGVLVGILVLAAVGAIWLLQGVLKDLDHVNDDAAALVDGTQELSTAVARVESELYQLQGEGRPLDANDLGAQILRARAAYAALGAHEIMHAGGSGAGAYAMAGQALDDFLALASRAAAGDQGAPRDPTALSAPLRERMLELVQAARRHVTGERAVVVSRLRMMVVGMSVAALIMVNLAVLLLLRTADMILRPVDALVEASRQLGREQFDTRVEIAQWGGDDEFGELARAYNSLAAQLAANEQRKVETLQQTSLMLSHEINNALSIISMQLALAERQASGAVGGAGNALLKQHLGQINASLRRIADTVSALGRIRRIVLTDYLPGQKMLDLSRSVEEDGAGESHRAREPESERSKNP